MAGKPTKLHVTSTTGLGAHREFMAIIEAADGKFRGMGHIPSGEFGYLVFGCIVQTTELIIWQFLYWTREGSRGPTSFPSKPDSKADSKNQECDASYHDANDRISMWRRVVW